jgi:hypothetical protein
MSRRIVVVELTPTAPVKPPTMYRYWPAVW